MADLGEPHRDADVVRVVEVFGDDVVLDVLWERGEEGPIRQCLRRLVSSPTAERQTAGGQHVSQAKM